MVHKHFVLLSLPLVLGGCGVLSDSGTELSRDVHGSTESTVSLRIADYVSADATRFTVQCPYGTVEIVEATLGLHSNKIPDYSMNEDRNAIVVSNGHDVIAVLDFSVTEIDLCPPDVSWHAISIDHPLTFSESPEGIWTIQADEIIGTQD